jgi:hypothetical protein
MPASHAGESCRRVMPASHAGESFIFQTPLVAVLEFSNKSLRETMQLFSELWDDNLNFSLIGLPG